MTKCEIVEIAGNTFPYVKNLRRARASMFYVRFTFSRA